MGTTSIATFFDSTENSGCAGAPGITLPVFYTANNEEWLGVLRVCENSS
jgi:hypothetical protein